MSDQVIVLAIIVGLLALLVGRVWRYDVVAMLALLAGVLTGVVPAEQAFVGFGHPATITVALVLMISRAMEHAGAADWVATIVEPAAKRRTTHIAALSGLGALLSTFMNNVGALGLLMPAALQSARKAERPPAMILMPLSFGCILGGLVTLIGTPPNIIIATYRREVTGAAFGMFDFTPVGLVTALAGLVFVTLVGWRLIPKRALARASGEALFDISSYLAEAKVPAESKSIGKARRDLDAMLEKIDAVIVGFIRDDMLLSARTHGLRVREGDGIVIEAASDDIDKVVTALGLELQDRAGQTIPLKDERNIIIEAVIAPRSRLEGRTVTSQRLIERYGFTVLGVAREGQPHRGRLASLTFRVGDVLLLYGEADRAAEALRAFGTYPLAERGVSMGQRRRAPYILGIFLACIAAATFGLLPIAAALALAVAAMVVLRVLGERELYDGVDLPIIVLLGALIPLGNAMQATGATETIAQAILAATSGSGPIVILGLIMIVTMTLSDVLNNAATAVVMAPIAANLAERLEANGDPFLMAVAIGASCAFLTPIGHQNNALVMGPGGYRFGDYWRMGLPLELLIVAVSLPMILLVWPL